MTQATAPRAQPSAPSAPGVVPQVQHNTEATSIAMRFWARSIGDRNPRHVVESYRSATDNLGFIAHPCWLYSVHDTVCATGPAGTVPVIAGTAWTFKRPVVLGERISSVARVLDQTVKTGRFAGSCVHQRVACRYLDVRGDELATAVSTLLHVDPKAAREAGKHREWKRWRYTREELERIESGYDAETVLGGTPRYWEDVAVGERLLPIVRGPLSSEEIVLFVGGTRPIPGMSAFSRELAAGLATGFIHPGTGAYETYAAGLVDDLSAQQLGFPAAHDYGIDRISQLGSLLGNWAGDAGRILQLSVRLLEPNMLGDTTWLSGMVVGSHRNGEQGCVDIELDGRNQRGQTTVQGKATVSLPLRKLTTTGSAKP